MLNLSKKQLIILIAIGGVIVFVIGYYIYTTTSNESYEQLDIISEEKDNQNKENVENEQEEMIVVHIAGEVKKPGIVKIKEGARIADIIEEAGGLTQKANITNINLAYIIEDGQKITIPSIEEKEEKENITTESGEGIINEEQGTSSQKQININKATKEQLCELQGIGESTAEKIITYRKENGNFKQVEDIKNVPGIGDAKYENIKDKISVK